MLRLCELPGPVVNEEPGILQSCLNPRESRKLQDDEEMYIDSFSIVSDRCSLQKRGGLRGRTQAQGAAFDAEYAGAA